MPMAAVVSTGYGVGYEPTSWTKSMSAARILPSSSNAIRTVPSTWRDWPGRHQVLAPVLDPLQRGRHLARGEQDAHVLAHRDDLLAERAAGVAHDDPDALGGDAQQSGRERAQLVRCLGGRPDGEFVCGRRPFDDHAAGLHRHRHVHLLIDVLGDDVRGGGEELLVGRHAAPCRPRRCRGRRRARPGRPARHPRRPCGSRRSRAAGRSRRRPGRRRPRRRTGCRR